MTTQQRRAWTEADWTDFVHTGPDTLAGQYLRLFWHPIMRSDDLPTGRAKPIRIMSEDLTLYRGEDGTPHCVAFRCAHRGTQLSTGWVEGNNIRCFYHGWMYGPDGQCVEQPAEPEPFCQRIKIRSYPAEEYIGLIFLYMGDGDPPPMYRFPQLDDGKYLEVNRFPIWPCSFWNRQENDPVHVAFVHREGPHGQIGLVEPPRVWAEETPYGMAVHEITPGGIESTGHRLMPAMTQFIAPDGSQNVGWKVPIDDTHCIHPVVRAIPLDKLEAYQTRRGNQRSGQGMVSPTEVGEAVLRGEKDVHDPSLSEITNIVNVQDYASMVGQGSIPDFAHEHLGQSDNSMIFWRRLWARELRALAEGRPLKQWTQSIHLTSERHFTDASRGDVPTTTGLGVLGAR
ncbi:MAG TPA: Rieske 2Fe-2S domain-containing protein [Chloroflexota bacterium]|nr:Rieske 2Fe-2S domain-containing protein [Chloroflexota bacterium]